MTIKQFLEEVNKKLKNGSVTINTEIFVRVYVENYDHDLDIIDLDCESNELMINIGQL